MAGCWCAVCGSWFALKPRVLGIEHRSPDYVRGPGLPLLGPVPVEVVDVVGWVRMGVGAAVGRAGVRRNGSVNARTNEMTRSTRPPRKQNRPNTAQPPVAAPVSCTELEFVGNAPVTLIVPCQEMMREMTPTKTRTVASVNSHWDFITNFRGYGLYRRLQRIAELPVPLRCASASRCNGTCIRLPRQGGAGRLTGSL
jgi:hypothetical protein